MLPDVYLLAFADDLTTVETSSVTFNVEELLEEVIRSISIGRNHVSRTLESFELKTEEDRNQINLCLPYYFIMSSVSNSSRTPTYGTDSSRKRWELQEQVNWGKRS